MPEITPPIFVLYEGDRLVAFDEVFEAEMTPVEHFERIERVVGRIVDMNCDST